MFQKANQAHKNAAPSQRPALAKQLFPSSSPSSCNLDIRDQLKRPASTSSGAAAASARTNQPYASPLDNRPVNLAHTTGHSATGSKGSLSLLYSGHVDSFESGGIDHVDLTGSAAAPQKIHESVYFAEDDFSDDADLDLDFEAPSALPQQPKPQVAQQPAPLPIPSQVENPIPWSSSPASHMHPANPPRLSEATSELSNPSLKRDSSGDVECMESTVQKKAKKRVLPASFRTEAAHEEEVLHLESWKTPTRKTKAPWDPSASVIKEQMKLLKSQRNPRSADSDKEAVPEKVHKEQEQDVKPVAISLSSEQEHVLDMVVNRGQSVFFTGPAGTGKSVLMRAIINELKKKFSHNPERVAVTASTGLAACIGLGKEDAPTLVRKIRRNQKAKTRWLQTKCLIIDEISMVDGDLFDKLSQIGRTIRNNGRPWGGIQLIITGDFFQLPPVPDADKKRESKFAFDAATWSTSIDHTIGLTQVFRQRDPQFARMLNEMRIGKISQSTVDAFKALSRPLSFDDGVDLAELFPTRAQVEGSNERKLRELPGKIYRYDAMDSGDQAVRDKLLVNMMAPKALELKVGAQVMLIKNLDETLVNGSLGKVIAFSDEKTFEMGGLNPLDAAMEDSIAKAKRKLAAFSRDSGSGSGLNARKFPVVQFISTGGLPRVILCQPEEWKVELPNGEVQAKRTQLPLILAWALSIHKAQGQTLERVTVNLGRVFEKGQAYVALSRATSQDGLRVLGFDRSKVMAHQKVIEFYGKLYSVEDAVRGQPTTIADFIANKKGVPSHHRVKTSDSTERNHEEEAMASYGH
ncbi:hypothetical protein UVI_02037920 [Ustilaginoidea virens]|uniref:ATP-dependent DNA helicase PIF1 n=1 Tax=Ustilaginoidea virens TaxID=1159556 RepID=A0A1B5KVT9_USTVR|nr:hypothetical protein UVI_02037920 [Ustilaginoidea virens]